MEKRTAIVAGATGLVGSFIVKHLIADDRYNEIISIGRRECDIKNSKIKFVKSDFTSFPTISSTENIDVFCALGTTIKKAGSQESFRKIDYEAVANLANFAKTVDAHHFVVVSSIGANKNSKNFYLRTKGEMEANIKSIGLRNVTIIRPSLIIGKRDDFRFGEKIGEWTFRIFGFLITGPLIKYSAVKAEKIAEKMIDAISNSNEQIKIIEGKLLHK